MYIIYLYHLEQLFNLICIPASAFLSMGVKQVYVRAREKMEKLSLKPRSETLRTPSLLEFLGRSDL